MTQFTAPAVPESTYRIQFHAGFTFTDAAGIVPYLKELGITHLYASPYLRAVPGSTHGYDVIDHNQLNPELGDEESFRQLVATLKQHGIEQILDTVPNHMGIGTNDNAWWNDVLGNGRASRHGQFFDIAWELSPRPYLHGKVLLPILEDHYGKVLESGKLKLVSENDKYYLAYYNKRLPVSAQSIERVASRVSGLAGELAGQVSASPDLLHELISEQHYRLAYWRTAPDEINYRRFFDINDLAALQMERQEVFDAAHKFTFRLVRDGIVAGLRIDHPDGLYDPQQYFQRLRDAGVTYVLAEKILGAAEPLPQDWAIAGTSGYDALNIINGLFVDASMADAFTQLYQRHAGVGQSFEQIAYDCKLLVLRRSMASELNMLAHMLDRLAQSHRSSQDFTLSVLTDALRQIIACFPVYRSYITSAGPSARDAEVIGTAICHAVRRNPEIEPSAFEFIRSVLLLQAPVDRQQMLRFAGKFQQLTAPVTAKGVEDTAFYRYNRLVSLNEVGGEPSNFGIQADDAHQYFAQRQRLWPEAMNTLSTHDTKRSEDVRARLNILSELPEAWSQQLDQWVRLCGDSGVHADDLYLLLQAIVGIWPMDGKPNDSLAGRLKAYMAKALREGKLRTSWTNPDETYESRVHQLIDRVLAEPDFQRQLLPLQNRLTSLGAINSLAQTVLKFTVPGVPDTYQGTELWDLSLVDPDNRRPVDYQLRQRLLQQAARFTPSMLNHWQDGLIKLFISNRLLHLRRANPGLFTRGAYRPLQATGMNAAHAFAFSRQDGRRGAVVVVPRLLAGLLGDTQAWPLGTSVWQDTSLTGTGELDSMSDVFTGDRPKSLRVADLLCALPVAVLISQDVDSGR